MTTYQNEHGSIRVDRSNPDHHLYRNNGGNWWTYYQSFPTPVTEKRVRRSLGTSCLAEARQKRDRILSALFPEYATDLQEAS